jgi:hypothetical protein
MLTWIALWLAAVPAAGSPPPGLVNVRDFGAAGDGVTPDTSAIRRAVDHCAASGGGTVYFPAGTYLTGTIRLRSNIALWLDRGARILGSRRLEDYQWPEGERDWYAALILGHDVENIAISGGGIIDGNRVFNPKGEEQMRGPHAFVCHGCRDLTVRDVQFVDAANYAVRLNSCERVNIDGITVRGGWDGINLWDTRYVTIANCRLFTGDDCLAGAWWENVTVSNCVLNTSCNAFRLGGRNVLITNCLVFGPGQHEHRTSARKNLEAGFQILPHRRAYAGRNRLVAPGPVDNLVLSNVLMHGVRSPVWIAFSPDAPYSEDNLGVGRIIIENLTVTGSGKTPFYVAGPREAPARSIVLRNVRMSFSGGATEPMADGQGYSPYSILQSYGFYFRNVERVELHDVRVDYGEADLRPALFGENVGTLELDRFEAAAEPHGAPPLLFAGIGKLLRDGRPVPSQRVRVLKLEAADPAIRSGERFSLVTELAPVRQAALAELPLMLGSETLSRSAYLEPGRPARIRFVNLVAPSPGDLPVRSADYAGLLKVQPRPKGRPVEAPFRAFANVPATLEQLEDGFYIRAAGGAALLDRADQYAAIYLENALPLQGEVTVRIENPDFATHWPGRMGIMVRNDIARPAESTGYLLLASSPANGSALEWDSDGDGRIDSRTAIDGYTLWPHWLRLERRGERFSGYASADGREWRKLGEAPAARADERLDAGLFVHLRSARFSRFTVTEAASGANPGRRAADAGAATPRN